MSSMSDGLEEWFLRTLDQAGRANVLCIQNREAAAMLLEMHKVLSSAEARGSGRVMFSFKGVAQYRDTNAYGQWSSIAGRSPAQCTLVLTTAPASPEPAFPTLWRVGSGGHPFGHPCRIHSPPHIQPFASYSGWALAASVHRVDARSHAAATHAVKTAEAVPWPRPRSRLCQFDVSS